LFANEDINIAGAITLPDALPGVRETKLKAETPDT
jgi:hypothetical protein